MPQFQRAAEFAQNQSIANEQYMMQRFLPPTGQLPMGIQPPMPQKKGSR
jgi:hypothetical protein